MPLTTGYANAIGGKRRTERGADAIAQTGLLALFTITGTVQAWVVEGEVTTALGAGANNLKFVANPTTGSDTDICAVTDFDAAAVATHMSITGTFATAAVKSANGAHVAQAAPTVLTAGTLDLSASASKTGAMKFWVVWEPLTANGNVEPTSL